MNYPQIKPTTPFDVVILAAGAYPEHPLPLSVLENARHIVCCDSAFILLDEKLVDKVEAIVGDGDSLSSDLKMKYQSILHLEAEQEDNDLTKATRYCLARGYKRIAYLGATGKREDHTLGNISLLTDYLRRYQLDVAMITDYGSFVPCFGDATFDSFPRQQVSIFNFTCKELTSTGLRWESYAHNNWWQGTLNETLSSHFSLHADGYYLVYGTHEAK